MWCRVYMGRVWRRTTAQVTWGDLSCGGRLGSWYAFELKPTAVLCRSSTLSNPAIFKISKPFFIASSPVHNGFQTCASRPNIVGSVSEVGYMRYPNLFNSYFALRSGPRCRCPAHLSMESTDTSFKSFFSAHVTDTFWLCNSFANRDQRSCTNIFCKREKHVSEGQRGGLRWWRCRKPERGGAGRATAGWGRKKVGEQWEGEWGRWGTYSEYEKEVGEERRRRRLGRAGRVKEI